VLTSETREAALARVGRALADPTRCRLLVALLDGPTYPAQLAVALGLSRPNVSNHLACLRGCGLVVASSEGRQTRYELADPHLAAALGELARVVLAVSTTDACLDAPEVNA
jgi:ArsR family transcriptional regulator, cadmium/lead-responsive transcriptional repressor